MQEYLTRATSVKGEPDAERLQAFRILTGYDTVIHGVDIIEYTDGSVGSIAYRRPGFEEIGTGASEVFVGPFHTGFVAVINDHETNEKARRVWTGSDCLPVI